MSTAYYALFHLWIEDAVQNWKIGSQRHALARIFNHGSMKKACEKARAGIGAANKNRSTAPPESSQLLLVSTAFIGLQQRRIIAGYDRAVRWSRIETLQQVASADLAFTAWKQIRLASPAQSFLLSLLLKDR